MKSDNKL